MGGVVERRGQDALGTRGRDARDTTWADRLRDGLRGCLRGLGWRIWLRWLRGGLRDWNSEFADGEPAASNNE